MSTLARYFGGTQVEVPPLTLDRPDGVPDQNWKAIQSQLDRLNGAIISRDLSLIVGSAKELAEAVAKVICDVRGKSIGSKADFSAVVSAAHTELDRQPGKGLATGGPTRRAAQAAKSVVCTLPETRNLWGTGHGRALEPDIVDEVALVSIDAAMLWIRWALRRLRYVAVGRPDVLVNQLDKGTFHRGLLKETLGLANLPALPNADQRLIGLHVGWRALRGTFLVQDEGVAACTMSTDRVNWPVGYREGLLCGLLITELGTIYSNRWGVGQIAELLRSTGGNLEVAFARLAEEANHAGYSPGVTEHKSLPAAFSEHRGIVPANLRASWDRITERLKVPF